MAYEKLIGRPHPSITKPLLKKTDPEFRPPNSRSHEATDEGHHEMALSLSSSSCEDTGLFPSIVKLGDSSGGTSISPATSTILLPSTTTKTVSDLASLPP